MGEVGAYSLGLAEGAPGQDDFVLRTNDGEGGGRFEVEALFSHDQDVLPEPAPYSLTNNARTAPAGSAYVL